MPELKNVEGDEFHPDVARNLKLQNHIDDDDNPHDLDLSISLENTIHVSINGTIPLVMVI